MFPQSVFGLFRSEWAQNHPYIHMQDFLHDAWVCLSLLLAFIGLSMCLLCVCVCAFVVDIAAQCCFRTPVKSFLCAASVTPWWLSWFFRRWGWGYNVVQGSVADGSLSINLSCHYSSTEAGLVTAGKHRAGCWKLRSGNRWPDGGVAAEKEERVWNVLLKRVLMCLCVCVSLYNMCACECGWDLWRL